jgi:hypothetical protein
VKNLSNYWKRVYINCFLVSLVIRNEPKIKATPVSGNRFFSFRMYVKFLNYHSAGKVSFIPKS